jgi:transcriptional regulator with XRE-family HTH domain
LTGYPYGDILSPKRIATMLKRVRKEKGFSQLELAKRSRVAQGYISELEAGREKNPGIETLRKLAKALGVPVAELLG